MGGEGVVEGHTSGENGLPLVVGLLDWMRHVGGAGAAVCAEQAGEEWEGWHRLDDEASSGWWERFERELRGESGCVVAEGVEGAYDGWESREAHKGEMEGDL